MATKEKVEMTSGMTITAGTDLQGKYSLALREVNNVWCICVFKCRIRGGLHYTKFSPEELVCAIPIKEILDVCLLKKDIWQRNS